jgi:NhaP-type Na+/H+ or K+/H+ antiporter
LQKDELLRFKPRLPTELSVVSPIQILVLLLAVIAAVAVVAARLEIPPSILLVSFGVVLALIPGLPSIEIAPEFVLLVVLPPIIYSSAV